jgi:hypothetical protein
MIDLILPIGEDALSSPNTLHLGILEAHMVFPADQQMRERAIQSQRARYYAELFDAGNFPQEKVSGLIGLALKAISPDDLFEKSKEGLTRGYAAGMNLYNSCIRSGRGESGAMTRTLGEIAKSLSGKEHTASHHVNDEVWKKFKPVAPLWAAHIIVCEERGHPTELPCNRADLPLFLKWSEEMFRIGKTTVPPRRHSPILKEDECWHLADALASRLPVGEFILGQLN